jgi:hypothetical protein
MVSGRSHGAKYAERSRINAVGLGANASIAPFVVGTMAMFAFCGDCPCSRVQGGNGWLGLRLGPTGARPTVSTLNAGDGAVTAFNTWADAALGGAHALSCTFTFRILEKAGSAACQLRSESVRSIEAKHLFRTPKKTQSNAIGTIAQLAADTPGSKEIRFTTCSTTSLRRPSTVRAARISMRSVFSRSTL